MHINPPKGGLIVYCNYIVSPILYENNDEGCLISRLVGYVPDDAYNAKSNFL